MTTDKAFTRAHENPRHARRGEEGFTLLETVIAMIVMMTVGLGASALFLYSITYNAAATGRAQALAVAQQEMERLRSVPWDDPLLDPGTTLTTATAGGIQSNVTKNIATVPQFDVTVGGVTRPTVKSITITVAPIRNSAPWAAAGVTVMTTRTTLQRGPN